MNFSFEAELRKAEATINRLIAECNRIGGGVYLEGQVSAKLTEPISIAYYTPIERAPKED